MITQIIGARHARSQPVELDGRKTWLLGSRGTGQAVQLATAIAEVSAEGTAISFFCSAFPDAVQTMNYVAFPYKHAVVTTSPVLLRPPVDSVRLTQIAQFILEQAQLQKAESIVIIHHGEDIEAICKKILEILGYCANERIEPLHHGEALHFKLGIEVFSISRLNSPKA
jgi:hypothetical protein